MPRSTRWSGASDSFRPEACRIPWRPSRWVVGALALLAVLAPFAVLASEMPRLAAWPLAGVAAFAGLRAAWREARRPWRLLALASADGTGSADADARSTGATGATLDGEPLAEAALSWRGPLAFLRWQDACGRRGRLSWWPDTLPPAERRVLKLWSPRGPGMAP